MTRYNTYRLWLTEPPMGDKSLLWEVESLSFYRAVDIYCNMHDEALDELCDDEPISVTVLCVETNETRVFDVTPTTVIQFDIDEETPDEK